MFPLLPPFVVNTKAVSGFSLWLRKKGNSPFCSADIWWGGEKKGDDVQPPERREPPGGSCGKTRCEMRRAKNRSCDVFGDSGTLARFSAYMA